MKLRSPHVTLLAGAVLAIGLWIASMVAASPAPAGTGYTAAGSATASVTPTATPSSAASSPTAVPSATVPSASAASPSPSATSGFVIPARANYVGEVMGNLGSIAIVVHDTSAVAYFCNGATIEAWMSGVPDHGKLALAGKNHASGEVSYALGHARARSRLTATATSSR